MRLRWALLAAAAISLLAAGCGSNSTAIGVTVIATDEPLSNPVTVLVGKTEVFAANVTGSSTTTVVWQICKPPSVSGQQPTNCFTNSTAYGQITQTGLYTAPAAVPNPNSFLVEAVSTVNPHAYGTVSVAIDSGIRVNFTTPASVSMAVSETYVFSAVVSGATNTAVTWAVNGIAGGSSQTGIGTITPGCSSNCPPPVPGQQLATYTAPAQPPTGSITVTATSAADPTQLASATVSIAAAVNPAISSIEPATAPEGGVQQELYITGSGLLSTSTVVAPINGVLTAVPTNSLSGGTLEAILPASALQAAGTIQIQVQAQNGNLSATTTAANLTITPMRPALLAVAPPALSQTPNSATITLIGGFFSGDTSAAFNGSGSGVSTALNGTRQMNVALPAGSLNTPGLYPVALRSSSAAAAGVPSMAGLNLMVTPNPGSIPGAAVATIAVGSNPSAVAIDRVNGWAVVANRNTGSGSDGSVSVVNLATNSVIATYSGLGNTPTGVAVDDLLPDHLALVVNNVDQTVVTIDLTKGAVVGAPLSVAIGTANGEPILPYSIAVNPLTHRAIIAYQRSNQATILDLSSGAPALVGKAGALGGSPTSYSTGFTPAIAIDPALNWAIVTPGGLGSIGVVDLGRPAPGGAGLPGRAPQVVATALLSNSPLTVQGVGINTQLHSVLFSNSNPSFASDDLTSFSLLNQSVNSVDFSNGGQLPVEGFSAAAVSSLTGVGIAVNPTNNVATIVDTISGTVLQSSVAVGSAPSAVAIDPASNEAVVANQGGGTVSVLSLGQPGQINPLQIVRVSPPLAATSSLPQSLTITGSGFAANSQVFLDNAPVATNFVSARELTATVPASLLAVARRFAVQVRNGANGPVSNFAPLTVVQGFSVGRQPFGVAVDPERDIAVVTNNADNTASLLALTSVQTGAPGVLATQPVGAAPEGVAVFPRSGIAVVANASGNDVTVLDDNYSSGSQLASPYQVSLCTTCTGPTGVAVDSLHARALVTNSTSNSITELALPVGSGAVTVSANFQSGIDQFPNAAAIDPNPALNLAAIAAASSSTGGLGSSPLDFLNLAGGVAPPTDSVFQLPTGVAFDPVNEMFLVASSLQNEVMLVNPSTRINTPVRVGINPTALDYSYQASTLVTANNLSNTLSLVGYVCGPNGSGGYIGCPAPQVADILPLASSSQFSVAVDAKLHLAVVADQKDNEVFLVPLP